MADLSLYVQKAVFDALSADSAIVSFVGNRIYDLVPDIQAFPYIEIGEGQSFEWGDDALTDNAEGCFDGTEDYLNLHIWSRYAGYKEVKQILNALNSVFRSEKSFSTSFNGVSVTGSFSRDASRYFKDPDGLTIHGVFTLKTICYIGE